MGFNQRLKKEGVLSMFSRMLRYCAALAVGVFVAGAANATSLVPISPAPAGPYLLTSDTQYLAFASHAGSDATSGSETYNFLYAPPPALTALNSTTNLTIGPNGFSSLLVSWIGPVGSGISQTQSGLASFADWPLAITLPGIYQLVLAWTLPNKGANGTYSTSVLTPSVDRQNPVPLPPALLLFGSALVGLGVLGRRKRQGAAG
jgi:hypothetical protein